MTRIARCVLLSFTMVVSQALVAASLADVDAAVAASFANGYRAIPSGTPCDASAEATLKIDGKYGASVIRDMPGQPPMDCGTRIRLYEVAVYRSPWMAYDAMESLRNADRVAWLVVGPDLSYVLRQFEFVPRPPAAGHAHEATGD